ncbi:hypothetical protein [Pseudonocardia sp. H11422]|uniref:hypothetical protein n=1 Tax=Pseudonocardia sp. H11422 TaxID=2835866 RepID=UPI0020293EE1|nr:hypothetical protein [Pseudonocardia sp. H11422]
MADEVRHGHGHSGVEVRPFWARARIDRHGLATVTVLTYSVARRWVPEEAARRFSRMADEIIVAAVERGEATLDMWEEPDRLVCRVARGPADPSTGPRWWDGSESVSAVSGPLSADASAVRFEVRHGPDASCVSMALRRAPTGTSTAL